MKPASYHTTYRELGDIFYQDISPTPVPAPGLIQYNTELAGSLGLRETSKDEYAAMFSGNQVSDLRPLAMAYSGHQFGHFNPGLGDGRAILLTQVMAQDGHQYDIQLKGSGRTDYSRNGDGRSALGPVIREYLLSESMHRLGIPTTRALAAVTTGEQVARERLTPGGIITRVSRSFVRVGTFQYLAYKEDVEAIRSLADYMITHCYPGSIESENPYLELFRAIVSRQASLIADWMNAGFIHGVMNTDNMSICGETIDYGPCAFMDTYRADQVYSSIDRDGRYAYQNQPGIGLWNLTRLAECLLPLFHAEENRAVDEAKQILEVFITQYQQYWIDGIRHKLGFTEVIETDRALADDLLRYLQSFKVDYTSAFRELSHLGDTPDATDERFLSLFSHSDRIVGWLESWRARLSEEGSETTRRRSSMLATNPVYIPRNHLVEAAIRAAEDEDDFAPFHDLLAVLSHPYEEKDGCTRYSLPPEEHEIVHQTFCGT